MYYNKEGGHKTPDELRMCLECKKFFSNKTFYKHKETCSSQGRPKHLASRPLNNEGFDLNIMNNFVIVRLKISLKCSRLFKPSDINIILLEDQNRATQLKLEEKS